MTYIDPPTPDEINSWPADSYAGRERDLADLVSDYTLEAIEMALETDEFAAYTLFILMMMIPEPRALTNGDLDDGELADFIAQIQDDARDDSSEPFQQRLAQRMALRNTIRNFTTIKEPND